MIQKLTAAFIASLILILLPLQIVLAKNDSREIPEVEGVYDDPVHPGVKVRVFVYREKPSASPIVPIACSPDTDSPAAVAPTGWKLPQNWTYNLNPSSVPVSVGPSNLETFASNAFSAWTSASGSKVNFTRGGDTTISRQAYDGQNIVAWGRTSGSALGVTYTRYYPSTGQVVDVDTIMNKKFKWGWSSSQCLSGVYDAQNILTHELGHWMGLTDHYTPDYSENTMFGYGSPAEIKKNTLTTGDITGTQAVYY